jgi:hypothetical protein
MQRFWVVFTFGVASLLGLLAVVAPVWILDLRHYTAPLFPLIRSGVEGMSLLTLVFLFCTGLLVGCFGMGHPLLLGIGTIALLPILAVVEMCVSSTTHNLWPLEFMIYGLIRLCTVAGAFAGRFAMRLVKTTRV